MRAGIVALAASALLLVGCSAPPVTETTATAAPSAIPTTVAATPAPTETIAAADPTCETLIPEQTVTDLEAVGWSYKEEPFIIGSAEITEGIVCKWGDFGSAGEGVQIYGWAPISDAAAATAQAELLANGWQTIETDEGLFITENPDTAFATGEQGYGLTYQFGDGWVIYADTKQSLLLIERPGA